MFIPWGQQKSPFRGYQKYSKVGDAAAENSRTSSDASSDGVLEKEIEEIRRKRPFWQRRALPFVLNMLFLLINIIFLAVVTSHVSKESRKGPDLIHCPLLPRSLSATHSNSLASADCFAQHRHMRHSSGRSTLTSRIHKNMVHFPVIRGPTSTRIGTSY